jgi:hypothetical protein
MFRAVAYQLERGSLQSPWAALGVESLQPVGQACVLALIAGAVVRLRRDPAMLAADPARIAAVSAAILIALELAASYWAFLYLAWIVPLLALSLFAPPTPARATAGDGGLVELATPSPEVAMAAAG